MPDDPTDYPPEKKPEVQPYELVQPQPEPPAQAEPAKPAARVGDKGLIEDFDEDADFTRDPEVEKALKGRKVESAPAPETIEPAGETVVFAKPGLGEPRTIALIAVGVILAAIVVASVNASARWWAAGLSTAYLTVLFTATGVVAVLVASHLSGMVAGKLDLVAARVFLAVAAFMLVFSLNLPVLGFFNRFAVTLLAVALYWLVLTIMFRQSLQRIFIAMAAHFSLSIALWAILELHRHLYGAAAAATPAAGAQ